MRFRNRNDAISIEMLAKELGEALDLYQQPRVDFLMKLFTRKTKLDYRQLLLISNKVERRQKEVEMLIEHGEIPAHKATYMARTFGFKERLDGWYHS